MPCFQNEEHSTCQYSSLQNQKGKKLINKNREEATLDIIINIKYDL